MIPCLPWRPQKLATRVHPLPPETSFAPFVLIFNLFKEWREPAVPESGLLGGVRWESKLSGLGLRGPFIRPSRKGERTHLP